MAFSSISSLVIAVGSAIKKELFDKIKNNFDDLDARLNQIETTSNKIQVIKFDVINASSFSTATGLYFYEADVPFTITSAYLRIFEVGSKTGSIEVDILRSSTDLDDSSFNSIFTTKPSVNYSTASDYDMSVNQVFDPGQISVSAGDFLKLNITQTPTSGVASRFLVTLYGE